MDFATLTDADLDLMRSCAKKLDNPNARWVEKPGHRQKNLLVSAIADPTEKYRIFVRVSESNTGVFSVGLSRIFQGDEALILLRYNSAHHPHRNILEKTRVPATFHRHIATHRYIAAGLDPDGYAEEINGYNSVATALSKFLLDVGIQGQQQNPAQSVLGI